MSRISLNTIFFLILIPFTIKATDITSKLQLEISEKQQQEQKQKFNGNIQNLLIHPSKFAFSEFIFPHLSPEGVLQMYEYFQKSYSNLRFPTFLETYYSKLQSNLVLGLAEEECIFYPFLANHISQSLYSKKTQMPIQFKGILYPNPRDEDILSVLPSNKIVPFFFFRPFKFGKLMLAQNPEGFDFCVALSKENGEFSLVFHGTAHDVNIYKNINLLWEAYTSRYETFSLKFTHRVTIPYLRYLRSSQIFYINLYKKYDSENKCVKLGFKFVLYWLGLNTGFLPFILLALLIQFLTNPVNFRHHSPTGSVLLDSYIIHFLSFFVFLIVNWHFLIHISKSFVKRNYDYTHKYFFNVEELEIFVIEPQKLMWKFPVLMQRKNLVSGDENIDELLVLFFIYACIVGPALCFQIFKSFFPNIGSEQKFKIEF